MEQKILKHLITTLINKKFRNPEKQRNFLIDCIASNGYIQEGYKISEEDLEDLEDLYQYFMPQTSSTEPVFNNSQEFKLSIQEQGQSSVDPYGFNRTFINVDSRSSDKLAELQKRGITYEETKFNKVKEHIESIITNTLNSNKIDTDLDKILQTALNLFLNIIIYYNTNPFGFNEIKGSLKNGYIFLCVYYAFIFNGISINKEKLISYCEKIRLQDIPDAEKNMKIIFHGKLPSSNNEDRLFKLFEKTLNIKNKDLKNTIKNVIEATKNVIPSTQLGLVSIIYFVCNEYYPFRVKINYKSKETFVTYSVLSDFFESFTSVSVRKITDQLRKIYKK